ncbi:hypothetical protein CCICO_06940 [Corynebacterium ciconiae DSM 44920]|uniref:N-acetyltransferase n=1 Tax=Corynebacterium ciconiae TaxID=227319 RepID=UPI00035ED5F0|nr:N-acetyltransferase [Corynebacterium ciconiae]WKD61408.1 hypothetical protein CCICO_06940 [Corynebacterium ciconiae DSM 44920]
MTVYRFSPAHTVPHSDAINTNLKTLALSDGFRAQMLTGTADRSMSVKRLCSSLVPAPDAHTTLLLLSAEHDLTQSPAQALDACIEVPATSDSPTTQEGSPREPASEGVEEVIDFSYGIMVSVPLLEDGCAATIELIADVEELVLPGEEMDEPSRGRYYYALELARLVAARSDRALLTTWLEHPYDCSDNAQVNSAYTPLLEEAGFRPVLKTIQGYVPLPDQPPTPETFSSISAAADKAGINGAVRWEYFCDELPEALAHQVSELYAVADRDAPRRDFEGETERWDVSRFDAIARLARENGTRTHFGLLLGGSESAPIVLGASVIAQATGSREDVAEQNVTVTARGFRGCGAGRVVKQQLLYTLRERAPMITRVYTSTEASNEAMLAINESLGFTPISRATAYQRRYALTP